MLRDLFKNRTRREAFFLGSPEAEGEASESSRMPLSKVYHDYHGLAAQLEAEKFVVIGRKGSGKSAFAEFVVLESQNSANVFAKFIKKNEFALESIVQSVDQSGNRIDTVAFLRWIIYVNLIKLFSESEAAQAEPKFQLLSQFLRRNSGFVDIKSYEIKDLIRKNGFEINTEYLKRFVRFRFAKDLQVREEKAPFYKLLPHLEEILISILGSPTERANKNNYVLFFDDLDLGYAQDNPGARDLIIELLRVVKEINNDVFGKRGLGAKVVVLLRDDIEKDIAEKYADAAKIFSSYGVRISWFQDGYLQNIRDEDDLFLKAFVNKRIVIALGQVGRALKPGSPWDSLVSFDPKGKSTFRHVVNHTLFRPRDLLLFFAPLQNGYISLPVDWTGYNSLATAYAEELAKELKNEMLAFFDSNAIEMIFRAIAKINRRSDCSYSQAISDIASEVSGHDPGAVLEYLFERSFVGSKDANGWYTFNCRARADVTAGLRILKEQSVVVQYGVREYVLSRY